MGNWWADKLAARRDPSSAHQSQPSPYPQQMTYTPQAYAQPQPQIPPGWVAYQTPQGLVYGPPQQPMVPMVGSQPFGATDTSQLVVTKDNIGQLAAFWRGGKGVTTERQPCPNCGGTHFFSRRNAKGRGPEPAPLCMTCGYNGLFEQASAETWGEAANG